MVHAPDTSILWANHRAAHLLGIQHDELTGKTATDRDFRLLERDGSPMPLERYPVMVALRTREPLRNYELGIQQPGGGLVWGRVTAEPVREEDGALRAVVVTFLDDTALHDAQEALVASEERLSFAIAGTQDGLWYVDIAASRAWFAPRFEELFGLAPGSLPPTVEAFLGRVHPDDIGTVLQAHEDCVVRRVPYDVTFRGRHSDDSMRWFRSRAKAQWNAQGVAVRMAGAITDVTEKRQAAQEQLRSRERMEQTARLESLAVLAGGVAHDFNNLLVGMLGAAEAARSASSDAERGELLDIIADSAERAGELTRQLMAYAGGTPRIVDVIDPVTLTTEVARLLSSTLPDGVRLDLHLSPGTPAVEVDPTLLQQVLMNLLVNAIDAVSGAAGGGQIRVRTALAPRTHDELAAATSSHASPGLFAVFRVEDDGPGMSAETARRVFEPFFTTKSTGHGLGLAAVQGLIRTHSGYVHLDTAEGSGTRFELGLPASAARPAEAKPPAEARAARASERAVLIVEDEPMVRDVLSRMLAHRGHAVVALPDGEALPQAIAEHDPHLVILDVTLPGESGIALLQRLRAQGDRRPVLLTSGHINVAERVRLQDIPAAAFLAKPYRQETLDAAIAGLLDA